MAKRLIDLYSVDMDDVDISDCTDIKDILSAVVSYLAELPTVDAVEVVRCRDCRWRGSEQCAMFYRCDCGEQYTWETDGDFCSYGERKEKEQ